MHAFLVEQKVHYTSVDPVRTRIVTESATPVIIWVGVKPGSLALKVEGSTLRYVNWWLLPLPRCTSLLPPLTLLSGP